MGYFCPAFNRTEIVMVQISLTYFAQASSYIIHVLSFFHNNPIQSTPYHQHYIKVQQEEWLPWELYKFYENSSTNRTSRFLSNFLLQTVQRHYVQEYHNFYGHVRLIVSLIALKTATLRLQYVTQFHELFMGHYLHSFELCIRQCTSLPLDFELSST